MYDLVTLNSTISKIFIERLKPCMCGCTRTLNMSILSSNYSTVVNVLPSNINLLEIASATNHV